MSDIRTARLTASGGRLEEPVTKFIRYLYLDVVGFTEKRSVDAQSDIIATLNHVVRDSVVELCANLSDVICLPAGDGMAIALLDPTLPFDVHLRLGLAILRRIHEHNEQTQDRMRTFQVRIGLNQNVDNLVTDINGARGVAGTGINLSQRVMSVADGGQLLVGQSVHEVLYPREKYMKSFRPYVANTKHGHHLPVYQFIDSSHKGLSVEIPPQFRKPTPAEQKLNLLEAYYLGHCLKYRDFLIKNCLYGQHVYALTVTIFYLARDSVEVMTAKDVDKPTFRSYGGGTKSLEEMFAYYNHVDYWMCFDVYAYAIRSLTNLTQFLDSSGPAVHFFYFTDAGREKLKADHPGIYKSLEL